MLDKQQIAKQAKKIMDSFIKELEKAEKIEPDFKVKRNQNIRDPRSKLITNPDFRERMLKNAPSVKDDCIQAEKKKW